MALLWPSWARSQKSNDKAVEHELQQRVQQQEQQHEEPDVAMEVETFHQLEQTVAGERWLNQLETLHQTREGQVGAQQESAGRYASCHTAAPIIAQGTAVDESSLSRSWQDAATQTGATEDGFVVIDRQDAVEAIAVGEDGIGFLPFSLRCHNDTGIALLGMVSTDRTAVCTWLAYPQAVIAACIVRNPHAAHRSPKELQKAVCMALQVNWSSYMDGGYG
jgi:hypothetical protein